MMRPGTRFGFGDTIARWRRGLWLRPWAVGCEVSVGVYRAVDGADAQAIDIAFAQNKELFALARQVATEAAEPIKTGVSKALNKAIW